MNWEFLASMPFINTDPILLLLPSCLYTDHFWGLFFKKKIIKPYVLGLWHLCARILCPELWSALPTSTTLAFWFCCLPPKLWPDHFFYFSPLMVSLNLISFYWVSPLTSQVLGWTRLTALACFFPCRHSNTDPRVLWVYYQQNTGALSVLYQKRRTNMRE